MTKKQFLVSSLLCGLMSVPAVGGARSAVSGEQLAHEAQLRAQAQSLIDLAQGGWSPLSRTAVAITGGVVVKGNVLVINGNTRYAIEPTQRVGQDDGIGGALEVEGAPFFKLRLLGQNRTPASRIRGPVYLRDGNTLCGDRDTYLYAQFETRELGGVEDAVLSVRIFEPPKTGPQGRPHYCAAYNYLKEVDDAPEAGAARGNRQG